MDKSYQTKTNGALFEAHANTTLERVRATYTERGAQYSDTWRLCTFTKMRAVADALGLNIDPRFYRALATAAFCDMKYCRNEGGYKEDSILDGIAYDAFLAEEMRILAKLTAHENSDVPPTHMRVAPACVHCHGPSTDGVCEACARIHGLP